MPESLAVDSKGNIYILDIVNNRIQKFDREGRYIKSIKVPSDTWRYVKENNKEIRYFEQGVNIIIDSEDILYYYFIKKRRISGKKSYVIYPEDTAEVWEFKDDVLVRKWEVPVKGFNLQKWIQEKEGIKVEKQKIGEDRYKIKITFKDGKVWEKEVKGNEIYMSRIMVLQSYQEILIPVWKNDKVYTYTFNFKGELSEVLISGLPNIKCRDKNHYYLKVKPDGIEIIRFQRERIK